MKKMIVKLIATANEKLDQATEDLGLAFGGLGPLMMIPIAVGMVMLPVLLP